MPDREKFNDEISLYSVMLHELAHWTGSKERLNRDFSTTCKKKYAKEELIAELCSAFVSVDLQLITKPQENTAAYLDNWLKVLKSDKKAIFQVSAAAQTAASYLNNFQKEKTP
jgi:antirestriction protein ArdC